MSFGRIKKEKKRILVVGSWAKEQVTIKNISMNPAYEVYAYMDTRNPGIAALVAGFLLGDLYDIKEIANYAKKIQADLVIPTTAAPLSAGLIDLLDKQGLPNFGPVKEAARLENDKAFTRRLLNKYGIDVSPEHKICTSAQEALEFAAQFDYRVVAKPIGLTDGLGVQMFGEQFKNAKELYECTHDILQKEPESKTRVIIEEMIEGPEFTLQCLVNDGILVPTPTVKDYKRLLPMGGGPNTASMGSISEVGFLPPFIKCKDYVVAERIMRDTCKAFKEETGKICRGFLYGQFMKTSRGIKLIEYNFRPGDPEWINIVSILKDNIADKIFRLLDGVHVRLKFEPKATVCKYIVPQKYPEELNQVLDVDIPKEKIKKRGVDLYYSCGLDHAGRLNVGSERGLAFVAKDETRSKAYDRVEKAIALVNGEFRYREDVGRKKKRVLKEKGIQKKEFLEKVSLRPASEKDFLDVYKFVCHCSVLENYPEHIYRILLRYFGATSLIAEYKGEIIGFNFSMISDVDFKKKRTGFMWQIGVGSEFRGLGLASAMIKKMEAQLKAAGSGRMELTIDPQNEPSKKLFEKNGYKIASAQGEKTIRINGNEALKDFYGIGAHFMLYGKQLI